MIFLGYHQTLGKTEKFLQTTTCLIFVNEFALALPIPLSCLMPTKVLVIEV